MEQGSSRQEKRYEYTSRLEWYRSRPKQAKVGKKSKLNCNTWGGSSHGDQDNGDESHMMIKMTPKTQQTWYSSDQADLQDITNSVPQCPKHSEEDLTSSV